MESLNGKLTRTPSSLLRSPTTVRSPPPAPDLVDEDKPHHQRGGAPAPAPTPSPPLLRLLLPLPIFLLFFFYLNGNNPLHHNLLFASLCAAAAAVLIIYRARARARARARLTPLRSPSSVQWFIGDDTGRASADDRTVSEGVEYYSSGDRYEGEFHKRRCNGSGVYSFFGKGRYEGDWVDGRYDGYGVETWARGSRYRGQYRKGLRHGFGVYRFFNGDCYAGEWIGGQSNGIGVQSCSDGSCYVGEFKNGVKHGYGCYYFRNGDKYSGEYFADKMHGFGMYHFANGHCYEGSWHEGRRQGFGAYAFRSGETRSGEWNYGVLKVLLPASDNAILLAVQAAREGAEKAFLVPRVEDQVNKSVAAANRAATAARVAAIKAAQNQMDGRFYDMGV